MMNPNGYHILYAEDDATLAFLTCDGLQESGYTVTHASDGMECLQLFQQRLFDICILDVMMPGKDGFELAAAIRSLNHDIPILFLSAKTLKEDRIKGLKSGADDYLVKPFSMEELLLKISVFLSRAHKTVVAPPTVYTMGNSVFDITNYELRTPTAKTVLTKREADLLNYFVQHKNVVLKRDQILIALWGKDDYFLGRSLDVFVSRLRKLLAEEPAVKIENVHGVGFKFTHPTDV